MPGTPSLPPSARRRARPRCEPLECRTLLSATASADVPVTFAQVRQALLAAWERLETLPHEAPPARTIPMDFDQDERADQLELLRPEGASSEILDFLAFLPAESGEGEYAARHKLTLGYVAGSLVVQDFDQDGVLDVFVTGEPIGPQPSHATLMLASRQDGDDPKAERPRRDPDTVPPLIHFPVVARDVTGDDLTDLVVTCPLTDTAWVLRGLGNGRFEDLPWLVRPVGGRPIASFVDDFDGDGRLDLVTVDSASDDVTFYSNLTSPLSSRTTISAGGKHPVAALSRDVNGDQVPDLVVANYTDGRVTLFLGGSNGLTLQETIVTPAARPTALASGSSEDPTRFFVSLDDGGSGEWVNFTLIASPADGPEVLEGDDLVPTVDTEPARTEGKLRALTRAGLDLVPTLVSPMGEGDDLSAPALHNGAGNDDTGLIGKLIRSQLAFLLSGAGLEEESELTPGEGADGTPRSEEQLALQRFLLGVEEASAPSLVPEGLSAPPAEGLFPLPAVTSMDAAEAAAEAPPLVVLTDVDQPAPADEPATEQDESRPEGDVMAGARQAILVALVSQVGVACGVAWHRRRKDDKVTR